MGHQSQQDRIYQRSCKQLPRGKMTALNRRAFIVFVTGGLLVTSRCVVSRNDIYKMDHRKMREKERECKMFFDIFGNERKVKAEEVTAERSGRRLFTSSGRD